MKTIDEERENCDKEELDGLKLAIENQFEEDANSIYRELSKIYGVNKERVIEIMANEDINIGTIGCHNKDYVMRILQTLENENEIAYYVAVLMEENEKLQNMLGHMWCGFCTEHDCDIYQEVQTYDYPDPSRMICMKPTSLCKFVVKK